MARRILALMICAMGGSVSPVIAASTVFYISSQAGDYIGAGGKRMLRTASFDFNVQKQGNAVNFSINDFTRPSPSFVWWHANFAAPSNAVLVPGRYLNATRYPFMANGTPGLDIFGEGRGCNMLYGWFDVLEAVYDSSGTVLAFAADFEQHCEQVTAPALVGSLRFNSSVPLTRRDDVLLDLGASGGVRGWFDGAFSSIHAFDPDHMATGDLDGNGQADAIFDFPGWGVWARYNGATWRQLHPLNAASMTTGDLDSNGRDDLIMDFPGFGTWIWANNTSWAALHPLSPEHVTIADLDGNGRDEAVLDFTGFGLWSWSNNNGWTQLHGANVATIVAADIDGNGRADLLLDFPGAGLWIWFSNSAWIPLHATSPVRMTAGDLDGNLRDDVVIEFAGGLVYAWMNNQQWMFLASTALTSAVAADVDGDGQSEVVAGLQSGGTHVWRNGSGWASINAIAAEELASAELDGR